MPDNYANTSFRSQSKIPSINQGEIALPNQSILSDVSGEVTDSRSHAMPGLLAQTKHYNAASRKGLLISLIE